MCIRDSWDTLRNNDAYYQDRFHLIRENFPHESTAIVAVNWRHVTWYLSEYVVLPFGLGSKWEIDEGTPKGNLHDVVVTLSELGVQPGNLEPVAIVLFDLDLMAYNESSTSTHVLPLDRGENLPFLMLEQGQAFHYGSRSFGVIEEE